MTVLWSGAASGSVLLSHLLLVVGCALGLELVAVCSNVACSTGETPGSAVLTRGAGRVTGAVESSGVVLGPGVVVGVVLLGPGTVVASVVGAP